VHSVWKTSIRFTLVTTLLLGLAYPLALTGIAAVLFPHQAAGSLITKDGKVIGSSLLAQSFTSDKYFHPRPRRRATAMTPPAPAARTSPNRMPSWSSACKAISTSWPRRIPASLCRSIW
jgi:K+-transporting ATPase ATPase C chain